MKKRRKQNDAADDSGGDGGRASNGARRPWDESKVLRDAQGRFAGSVKQTSPFTEQQIIELKDYKEGNYQVLNSYLANPSSVSPALGKELDKQIKTIDSAIAKSVLTHDTVVFRGVKNRAIAQRADSLIGKTLTPPNYLSTSTSSSTARDFAGMGDDSIVLAIKAKAGSKAAYLDQFETSNNANENELLFPRDSKLTITGVDRSRTPPVITAEFE